MIFLRSIIIRNAVRTITNCLVYLIYLAIRIIYIGGNRLGIHSFREKHFGLLERIRYTSRRSALGNGAAPRTESGRSRGDPRRRWSGHSRNRNLSSVPSFVQCPVVCPRLGLPMGISEHTRPPEEGQWPGQHTRDSQYWSAPCSQSWLCSGDENETRNLPPGRNWTLRMAFLPKLTRMPGRTVAYVKRRNSGGFGRLRFYRSGPSYRYKNKKRETRQKYQKCMETHPTENRVKSNQKKL